MTPLCLLLALAAAPHGAKSLADGQKALVDFRPEEAMQLLEKAKTEGPYGYADHAKLYEQLGIAYAYLDLTDKAPEAFDTLLECGANPAAPLRGGTTLLMVAAEAGETGVMEKLVEAGLDPDCADENGKTALMYAAENGKGESTRKLLALGANPSVSTAEGLTARQIAEQAGHEHILYTIDNAPRKGAPAPARSFRIKLAGKNV